MREQTEYTVHISRQEVLEQLDCSPQSDSYEVFAEECEEVCKAVETLCAPCVKMREGVLPQDGRAVLYVFWTIGKRAEQISTDAFAQGDYVRGMLADAAADAALFSLEPQISQTVRRYCGERQCGIAKRLEAPHDLPMEIQRTIYEAVDAAADGVTISEGFMFDPVKSSAAVYLLTEDAAVMNEEHDCAGCANFTCRKRRADRLQVKIVPSGAHGFAETAEAEKVMECRVGETLLDVLQREQVFVSAPCAGRGCCGKCRIKVVKGVAPASPEDAAIFTEEQLREGWRLACRVQMQMNLVICLPDTEEDFYVLNEAQTPHIPAENNDTEDWGIAIDLGTTTIAMQRISLERGCVLDTWSGVNHQRSFGADVIARIAASVRGNREKLREIVCADLTEGVRALVQKAGGTKHLRAAALAGNTAMIHLLRGYDCTGMMEMPFVPESMKEEYLTLDRLLASEVPEVPVYLFPAAAAFVGGDITAGAYACGFAGDSRVRMLIDLGTNGEMIIGNRDGLLCASAAAGPAFEGGAITYGMGSLPGAINGVELEDGSIRVQTLGNIPPRGICGTGLVEAAAALLQMEWMDETGRLEEPYFDEGYPLAKNEAGETIFLTQRDIREIQLAKAAIRAGIETLLARYGAAAEDVEEICLAGGFGFALDCRKAIDIGMFPQGFAGRITIAGNSALRGCARYLTACASSEEPCREPGEIAGRMREIPLSSEPVFQEYYMEGMMFAKE